MTGQTEAACNVALKEKYPSIDDPVKAIKYALHIGDFDCFDFLMLWSDGDWNAIEIEHYDYLSGLATGWEPKEADDLL